MRKGLTIELLNEMDFYVCEYYGHIDEFVYSDLLYMIKFGLGMIEGVRPDDYMYDIFDKLGITKGCFKDEGVVALIEDTEDFICTNNMWQDFKVITIIKAYLSKEKLKRA